MAEQDELAGLSDEEKAAITDEDTDEKAALDAVIEEGGEAEPAAAGAEAKPAEAAAEPAAAAAEGEAKPAEAAAAEAPIQTREVPFIPRSDAQPVENYDTRMQELDAKRKEVVKRFKDGEIQLDEMMSERDRIDDERATLREQQNYYENSRRGEEVAERQLWNSQVSSFQRQHPEYGLVKAEDGQTMVPANPALYFALDGIVKQLGTDPKVIAEHGNDGFWYLEEAHRRVQAQMAAKAADNGKPAEGAKAADDKGGKQPTGRKPDLKVVPKTLGGLPAAQVSEAGEQDEFAHLDKLDGIELEVALQKLTPEQQKRYATNLGY